MLGKSVETIACSANYTVLMFYIYFVSVHLLMINAVFRFDNKPVLIYS